MARPRQFDPDEALDRAMHLFWARGYAETSYDDLVAATGASRKGLYAAFGDKRALFLRALERYRACVVARNLMRLDGPDATPADVHRFFRGMAAQARTEEGRRGCLVANTAAGDEARHDPQVRDCILDHFDRLRRAFRNALAGGTGAPDARSPDARSPDARSLDARSLDARANALVGVFQGLLLLAKAGAPAAMIDDLVDAALAGVAPPPAG